MWSAKCPKCGAKILLEDANAKVVQCASCGAQVSVNINVNHNYSKSEHTEHIVDDAKIKQAQNVDRVINLFASPIEERRAKKKAEEERIRKEQEAKDAEEQRVYEEWASAQLPRQSITIVPTNGKSSSVSFSLLLFSPAVAFMIPSIKSGNRNLPPIRPSLPA